MVVSDLLFGTNFGIMNFFRRGSRRSGPRRQILWSAQWLGTNGGGTRLQCPLSRIGCSSAEFGQRQWSTLCIHLWSTSFCYSSKGPSRKMDCGGYHRRHCIRSGWRIVYLLVETRRYHSTLLWCWPQQLWVTSKRFIALNKSRVRRSNII